MANLWREEYPSQTPRELMAHWIELLAKYRHFDHLQIQDDHLNMIQYFSMDIIGFLLLGIVVVVGALAQLLCCKGKKMKNLLVKKARMKMD